MNPALMGSMAHQLCTSQPSLSVAGFLLLEGLDPSGTSNCRVDSMSPAVSPLPVASFVSPPQLADFDPEWENREKGECERLNQVGLVAQTHAMLSALSLVLWPAGWPERATLMLLI